MSPPFPTDGGKAYALDDFEKAKRAMPARKKGMDFAVECLSSSLVVAAQTPGAGINLSDFAGKNQGSALNIGHDPLAGMALGMAYIPPERSSLATDITLSQETSS